MRLMWQAAKISAVTTHTERRAGEQSERRRKKREDEQDGLGAFHRHLG